MNSLPLFLFSLLVASTAVGQTTAGYLSCETPDRTIQLKSEIARDQTEHLELSIGKNFKVPYVEGDKHRVLYFSNGETVVREFSTGQTVLTFKQIPLQRTDRGFEKRMLVSQSRYLKAPVQLQCRTIFPEKNKLIAKK